MNENKNNELNNMVDNILNEIYDDNSPISDDVSVDDVKVFENDAKEEAETKAETSNTDGATLVIDKVTDSVEQKSQIDETKEISTDTFLSQDGLKTNDNKDSVDTATRVIDKVDVPTEKKPPKPSNAAFLHSLEEKKVEAPLAANDTKSPAGAESTRVIDFKLNDKYKDKVLPNTDQIDIDEKDIDSVDKKELKQKRKNKVKDFVLVRQDEDFEEDDESDILEYTEIGQAKAIMKSLNKRKIGIILRLLVLVLTSSLLFYISFAYDNQTLYLPNFISKASPVGYISFNVILGIISSMVAMPVIIGGLKNLFTLKADEDSVCAVTLLGSILIPLYFLFKSDTLNIDSVVLYISIAVAGLMFNTIGKLLNINRLKRNFKFVSGSSDKYGIENIENEDVADAFTKGSLVDLPQLSVMRETEFLTDFLKNSSKDTFTTKICKIATPLALVIAIIIAVACGFIYKDTTLALSAFAGTLCIAVPFSTSLLTSIPLARASSKGVHNSFMVSSYSSAEEFADTNSVLLNASDLFPVGSISLVAFKIFGNKKPDEAILYAGSLCIHANSVLSHIFYDIIGGKISMLKKIENFVYEDSMGMSAWIDNRRVLLGNRELMKNHGITIPSLTKEKKYIKNDSVKVVYLSISGEVVAVFHIEMKPSLEVGDQLEMLDKNNINIMLKTVDSVITVSNIAEIFNISPSILKILPFRLHKEFDNSSIYKPKMEATAACDGKFSSFAAALVASKRIRKITRFVSTLHIASMILGVILFGAFALLSAVGYFAPSSMIIYYLAWAFIIALIEVDAV